MAISQRPWGGALLAVGDFGTNLATPEGQVWRKEIVAAMAVVGLVLLPSTAQDVVEGQGDVVNALRRPGGVLPDRLHPGHRISSAPERCGPGQMKQHRPLLGPGLPPRKRAYRAISLSWEADTIPHQVSNDPGRGLTTYF